MPRIISIAIRKIMNEPAIANEETSIPKIPRSGLPINKNAKKINEDTIVTFPASILPDFDFMSIMIGIEPVISIIAKRTIKAASISRKLKCIADEFGAKIKKIMNSPPVSSHPRESHVHMPPALPLKRDHAVYKKFPPLCKAERGKNKGGEYRYSFIV
jgi:hypothetical protein